MTGSHMLTKLHQTSRRFWALFVVMAVALVFWLPQGADAAKETKLSAEEKATIEKITTYFNNFRYLNGEFVQRGPSGHISQGIFYMSKPGRLRFEYSAPNPFLVVADGTYVIVKDRRLKHADHYPLSATPLRLVLSENIDLLEEAKIIHFYQDPSIISLTLEDKDQWVPGQLTLVFDNTDFALQQWVIIDGQGNRTSVHLTKLETDIEPDPKLFEVEKPREIDNNSPK